MLKKETILIVGDTSRLGSFLLNYLDECKFKLKSTTRNINLISNNVLYVDLSNINSIDAIDFSDIDVSIICSSITNQKQCERYPDYAYKVNVTGTLHLIRKMVNSNIHVIFPSSSLVYDGSRPSQGELDPKNPIGKYASFKHLVEKEISKSYYDNICIIRISKIIYKNYPLFMDWFSALDKGDDIFPFKDLLFSPVYISFVGEVINSLVHNKSKGVFNLSSSNDISYFDALKYLASHSGFSLFKIYESSAKDYIGDIHLPKYTTLDCSETLGLGFNIPKSEDALDFFICDSNLPKKN
ncbi:sugar nucleotide-binding protein [Candidatus Thioglobus sp.]|nr:sugar nucleotide-binding protein [Candidatus Thioglobus sp.]